MNRPDNMVPYGELDLKLGIKSSLPHVKSTIALALLMWESAGRPSELKYSEQQNDSIAITDELSSKIIAYTSSVCNDNQIESTQLITKINDNQLFKSQMEALIVAFELIWKIAKVNFVEINKPASSERTGGVRYPKTLSFSINADIIHSIIESNKTEYLKVLLSWIGINIDIDSSYNLRMIELLSVLAEGAIFKLTDGNKDVIFNQNSIYRKIIETSQNVDINGDKEAKGSLRILKSLLSDGLNPYLNYSGGVVSEVANKHDELIEYQKRVDTFLRLSSTKVIGLDQIVYEDTENICETPEDFHTENSESNLEEIRVTGGSNTLLYGVPGAGKSWTIAHEYCNDESLMERLVFHPDFTYSDFVGQILPHVSDGIVSYAFTPGPFTSLLKKAYTNPDKEYFLVIEEINRGNAPAIFGEVFQLLDRKTVMIEGDDGYPVGTSEYGISNSDIANVVYGNPNKKVRIPSNMSIIGTMNTSDQNVFTLDTAFQRRWDMRMIENSFANVNTSFANKTILDTSVTWKVFCTAINHIILEKNVRMTSSEDKRLGTYFIHLRDLVYDDNADNSQLDEITRAKAKRNNSRFPEKVLKYLWDDAFKFSREDIFEVGQYNSLEAVIKKFMKEKNDARFTVFKENVYDALVTPNVDEQRR